MKILAASPSKTMMFTVVSNCPHLSRYSVNVTIVYNLPSWLFVKYGSVLCSMALHHPNSIPNLLSSLKNFHSNALALVSVLFSAQAFLMFLLASHSVSFYKCRGFIICPPHFVLRTRVASSVDRGYSSLCSFFIFHPWTPVMIPCTSGH